MKRLKRRELPLFCKLEHRFDMPALLAQFRALGLDDFTKYNDLNGGSDFYEKALSYRRYLREWFLTPEEKITTRGNVEGLSGEQYRQIALTAFDPRQKRPPIEDKELILHAESKKTLMKRVDPTSPLYVPEADERNYTQRTDLAVGAFAQLLDSFRGRVTRSRFAVLMPGFRTATHIDADTDYTIRIHIPLVTNPDCHFGIIKNNVDHRRHLPADGSAWFVNAGFPHYVENLGCEPRVHIIVALDGQQDLPSKDLLEREGEWG